jgi:hypothetical protein
VALGAILVQQITLYFIMPVKLLMVLVIFVFSVSCVNITGDCENKIYQRIASPDKKMVFVKFDRGCGATVGNSIQLSLIESTKELPNDAGNVFISDAHGNWDYADTSVSVEWVNNKQVAVHFDSTLRVYLKKQLVDSIQILFIPK